MPVRSQRKDHGYDPGGVAAICEAVIVVPSLWSRRNHSYGNRGLSGWSTASTR